MNNTDITKTVKRFIKYGLICVIAVSTAIGGAAFNYQNRNHIIKIDNAKVAGTMVSVRVLTNGKVKELIKADGDEVKAGDIIAKIEVNITDEEIKQLENTVELAKQNYAKLQVGQMVKVPVMKPKPKPITTPKPKVQVQSRSNSSGASLSALEERKNRMELLFEMGAISRNQRDEAVKEYELAKAAANAPAVPEVAEMPDTTDTSDTSQDFEIEYVEQLQPTPTEILNGAQLAIKQAELSLNVAKQEAQQTDIIAPIDGVIYYTTAVDNEINAGDVVAKVGGNNELWIEAEVTESQFDRISLGKLVSYVIDGKKITGTVMEKIAPSDEIAEAEANAQAESTIPAEAVTTNELTAPNDATAQLEADKPTEQNISAETSASTNPNTPAESNAANETTADNSTANNNTEAQNIAENNEPPKMDIKDNEVNPNQKDKYIVKFSLPADRDFECKPNITTSVTIAL